MDKPRIAQTSLSFDEGVIEKIAGLASRKVDGILSFDGGFFDNITDKIRNKVDPTQGIKAEVGEKQVSLEMNAKVEYGYDIREIFTQVCDVISEEVSKGDDPTTGVNVDVDDENHSVSLKMDAILEYGKNAQAIFDKMIVKITSAVKEITNMEVSEIKLNVKDVLTREEWAEKNNKDRQQRDDKH